MKCVSGNKNLKMNELKGFYSPCMCAVTLFAFMCTAKYFIAQFDFTFIFHCRFYGNFVGAFMAVE
jgi:hypothetical protein